MGRGWSVGECFGFLYESLYRSSGFLSSTGKPSYRQVRELVPGSLLQKG